MEGKKVIITGVPGVGKTTVVNEALKKLKRIFSTTLNNDLLKEFKKLCVDLERPINDLLEEAMADLLKKYKDRGIRCP